MIFRLLGHQTRSIRTAHSIPRVPNDLRRRQDSLQNKGPEGETRPRRARQSHDKNGQLVFRGFGISSQLSDQHTAYRRALQLQWKELNATNHKKMKCHVQILTTPSADTAGTTLLLHFDSRRYLIGSLGEGTQRAITSAGARLFKVSDCYITGKSEWRNLGGLMGAFLTLADSVAARDAAIAADVVKNPPGTASEETGRGQGRMNNDQPTGSSLTLFGPPNLNHVLATARRFIFRKGLPLILHEVDDTVPHQTGSDLWAPYTSDEFIKVWAMAIRPTLTQGVPSSPKSTAPLPASPLSPRKRTFAEVSPISETPVSDTSEPAPTTAKDVVQQMFGSDWQLDALQEVRLGDVNLPATIFYRDTETKKIEKYEGPLPGQSDAEQIDLDRIVLVRSPWPAALVENLPATKIAPEAISYIIRNHRQRGKFLPEKAKEHHVSGPDRSKLVNGDSVINSEGELITPEMVMSEGKEGGGIAVVDLPDATYIDALLNRPEWREPTVISGVGAIVWICGFGVADDARIHEFMEEFDKIEHIISSPEVCPNSLSFERVAVSTMKLRQIDPKRYPRLLYQNTVPSKTNDAHQSNENIALLSPRGDARQLIDKILALPNSTEVSRSNIHIARRGLRIQLEPTVEIIENEVTAPSDVFANPRVEFAAVQVETEKAHAEVSAHENETSAWASCLPPGARDAEVITLGTGSAMPSLYRNVSATLLRVPGWGTMLLDCGENTVGQIRRIFPPEEVRQIFRDLRIIWISHMHADHHLGTVGAIKAWYNEFHGCKPSDADIAPTNSFSREGGLAVISDTEMQRWLIEYAEIEDYGYSRIAPLAITPAEPGNGVISKLHWYDPALSSKPPLTTLDPSFLGLQDVQAVRVSHCKGARAVAFTFPGGFKVSYSGDCRPSTDFALIGQDSTLCIHEATFDDELRGDALAKKHSTTSDALSVADIMRAKACLLTHFSQRYQKLPIVEYDKDKVRIPLDTKAVRIASEHQKTESKAEDSVLADLPRSQGTHTGSEVTAVLPETDDPELQRNTQMVGEAGAPETSGKADKSTFSYKIKTDMKVGVAFDYMRIKIGEFPELSRFTTAISTLFLEEEKQAELESAATKAKIDADLKTKAEEKTRRDAAKQQTSVKATGKRKAQKATRPGNSKAAKEVAKLSNAAAANEAKSSEKVDPAIADAGEQPESQEIAGVKELFEAK